eukprot:GILK01004889.1.p1 GENE.GILK01004889.1~~GILK01004889.1.p1  ORF type:complete len:678 (-),score=44.75 GILK01004889.1:226-2259(-)
MNCQYCVLRNPHRDFATAFPVARLPPRILQNMYVEIISDYLFDVTLNKKIYPTKLPGESDLVFQLESKHVYDVHSILEWDDSFLPDVVHICPVWLCTIPFKVTGVFALLDCRRKVLRIGRSESGRLRNAVLKSAMLHPQCTSIVWCWTSADRACILQHKLEDRYIYIPQKAVMKGLKREDRDLQDATDVPQLALLESRPELLDLSADDLHTFFPSVHEFLQASVCVLSDVAKTLQHEESDALFEQRAAMVIKYVKLFQKHIDKLLNEHNRLSQDLSCDTVSHPFLSCLRTLRLLQGHLHAKEEEYSRTREARTSPIGTISFSFYLELVMIVIREIRQEFQNGDYFVDHLVSRMVNELGINTDQTSHVPIKHKPYQIVSLARLCCDEMKFILANLKAQRRGIKAVENLKLAAETYIHFMESNLEHIRTINDHDSQVELAFMIRQHVLPALSPHLRSQERCLFCYRPDIDVVQPIQEPSKTILDGLMQLSENELKEERDAFAENKVPQKSALHVLPEQSKLTLVAESAQEVTVKEQRDYLADRDAKRWEVLAVPGLRQPPSLSQSFGAANDGNAAKLVLNSRSTRHNSVDDTKAQQQAAARISISLHHAHGDAPKNCSGSGSERFLLPVESHMPPASGSSGSPIFPHWKDGSYALVGAAMAHSLRKRGVKKALRNHIEE